MNRAQYQEYLKSLSWRETRKKRLAIDGYKCAVCGSKDSLNVHHLTYENLGHENVDKDLITLCHKCHASLHRIKEQSTKERNEYEGRKNETTLGFLFHRVHSLLVVELWTREITHGGDLRLFDTGMKATGKMIDICKMIYPEINQSELRTQVKQSLQLMRAAQIVENYIKTNSIGKTADIMGISTNAVQKTLKRHGFNANAAIK